MLKRLLKFLFGKRPIQIRANIVKLAPSELLMNRCALITGGTSGIGYSIAEAMLDAGAAKVIITGRSKQKCADSVEKIILSDPTRKGRISYRVMDNQNVGSFDEVIDDIIQELGGNKLSILVNNAGIQSVQFGDATEENFDNVIGTNLKGMYFLSQKVARYMVKNNIEGNILNVASSSSLRPAANAYTISKVGVKEITAGMAKTLIPYGIVVNGVAPGPTATPMLIKSESDVNLHNTHNPLGRYAMPEEIANMAVILTSNMGRTIVGSIVYMSGGGGITTFEDVNYPF